MELGRKIYYGKSNGVIIWDKGQMSGSVRETTFEEDCIDMPILALINNEELGMLQLNYGEYATEFATCYKYSIINGELIFDYSFPSPVPQEPSEIDLLKEKLNAQDSVLTEILEDILPEIFGMLG